MSTANKSSEPFAKFKYLTTATTSNYATFEVLILKLLKLPVFCDAQ